MASGKDNKKRMTTQEAGRKGGQRVKEKYGHDFYTKIGTKGGQSLVDKRGADYFAEIGKRGGDQTLRRHGIKHYSQIGTKANSAQRDNKTSAREHSDA